MGKIDVLIVDDHDFFVEALNSQLSFYDDINVVASEYSGHSALKTLKKIIPAIIIIDFIMPNMDGIELANEIQNRKIPCKIVMISTHDDEDLADRCLEVGAYAFLSKRCIPRNIVNVLRRVDKGEFGIVQVSSG